MKKLTYLALLITTAFSANAQVKIGSSPTAIVSGARLQVDGDATTTVANPAKMIVAGTGYVGIGNSAPAQMLDIVAIGGTNTDDLQFTSYGGAGANPSPYFRFQSASGTPSAPGFLIGSGVRFGLFSAAAYNGSGFANAASIAMWTTQDHSVAKAIGTALTFSTAANGATVASEKMRLDNSGYLGIGTTQPTSPLQVIGLPIYASDAAAGTAGLTTGAFFQDTSGLVHIKQ